MKFIKTSGILFAGNVSIAFSSLILGVLTARYLGPEGRGLLYLIMQIVSTGALLFAAGLGAAYQYHLSSGIVSKSTTISHMLIQLGLVVLMLAILLILGNPLFDIIGVGDFSLGMLIVVAVAIALNVAIIFIGSILMTEDRGVLVLSVLNVCGSVANAVLFVGFVLIMGADVNVALMAYFLGIIVRIIPGAIEAKRGAELGGPVNWWGVSKKLYHFGAASFLFSLVVGLVFRVDTFIINRLAGLEELGKYAIAVTFAELVLMLPNSIGAALFAHLPTLNSAERIALLKMTTRKIVAITLIICLFLELLSPLLVTTLMGDRYVESIAPLRILLPGLIAMATNFVFANYFAGSGRPMTGAWVFAIGLVTNILMNFALIPFWGINGAAFASTISYFVIAIGFILVLKREHSITATSCFIPTNQDVREIVRYSIGFLQSVRRSARGL